MRFFLLLGLALSLAPATANATSITITTDTRYVAHWATFRKPDIVEPGFSFDRVDHPVDGESWSTQYGTVFVAASLGSTITLTSIEADVVANGEQETAGYVDPGSQAVVSLGFMVDAATPAIWDDGATLRNVQLSPDVLYTFDVRALAVGGQSEARSLSLRLVPEPGTLVMLGVGFAALGARRRVGSA